MPLFFCLTVLKNLKCAVELFRFFASPDEKLSTIVVRLFQIQYTENSISSSGWKVNDFSRNRHAKRRWAVTVRRRHGTRLNYLSFKRAVL